MSIVSSLTCDEIDFLLSLLDSAPQELQDWLSTLPASRQREIIDVLGSHVDRKVAKASAPATPLDLARVSWGTRWLDARHLTFLNSVLVEAAKGNQRIIVSMPPRHGKSVLAGEQNSAWYVGTHPDKRVILTTYEADDAAQRGRRSRELLENHGHLFGVRVSKKSSAADRWDLEGRAGGMLSVGAGGPIMGKGADLLIIDDPIKNAQEALSEAARDKIWNWYQSTAETRLEPNASVVLIMHRWHEKDLAGRLIEQGGWRVISFPALAEDDDVLGRKPGEALWPERYPVNVLEGIRDKKNLAWWLSLYQQRPGRGEGAEWPDEYFANIWADEWPTRFDVSTLALDPSKGKDVKKGDYSAIVFVGVREGRLFVDCSLERRPPTKIISDMIEWNQRLRPDGVGIEVNQFQELLASDLRRQVAERGLPPMPILEIDNRVTKEVRIGRLGPYLARGEIRVRPSVGGKMLVEQMREFPLGNHDDGPDALEMAIRTLRQTCEQPDEAWSDGVWN